MRAILFGWPADSVLPQRTAELAGWRGHHITYDEVRGFLGEGHLSKFANPAETGLLALVGELFGILPSDGELQSPDFRLSPVDVLVASQVVNGELMFFRYTKEQ